MIYRCGRLNESDTDTVNIEITDSGRQTMLDLLGIRTEIDVRMAATKETGGITASPLADSVAYINCPMEWDGKIFADNQAQILKIFSVLADENSYPLIIHCNIGTDRTGMLSFLINALLGVPEEFGGIPADYVTQMLALMEVSKCGAPAFLITNGQCIHSMRRFGSAEQLRKTAESTLETGDPAYALALTEPGAGSDNNSATTTYTRKNGKVYINGQKTFITGAKEYPYMLVLARDPQPKDPKKAFTLWWVDSSKPGIKINPLHKIGWHMLSTCEVYLDNVEVEESDMVGEEGMGFLNVMYNFEMERLINAARSTGFAECAFEDAARYANQRIAFGKPIGHNQMIQEKLALMAIKIDNMRNMVLKVAWQADQHQSLRTSAALAKLYCARTAMEVIDDAIQIMGGLGYTDEARVSRFWRDVRCERIGGGTDEIMIYVAGRQILKDYQNK